MYFKFFAANLKTDPEEEFEFLKSMWEKHYHKISGDNIVQISDNKDLKQCIESVAGDTSPDFEKACYNASLNIYSKLLSYELLKPESI